VTNIKDKIAIIGFGASGFGTYLGLKEKGFKKIYIYDPEPLKKKNEIDEWNSENLKENYKLLKNKLGYSTANSKTYFGNNLNSINLKNIKIYDNQIGGGLLNFWGGVLQKFDRKTLNSCLKIDDLDDYYFKISKKIPISQIIHKNSQKNIYSNQENIRCHNYIEEIEESIIGNSPDIIKKDTILAISQNKKKENCHCFIGCLKHTIFKTNNLEFDEDITFINEKVIKIDFDKNTIISNYSSQTFDKIYLNAGPYYDQKILLESLENSQNSIRVKDSASFTFPIYFKGDLTKNKVDFALTNYMFSIKDNDKILGHAQVYPPVDHINKSIFPEFLWNKFDLIKNLSINRLLWVRCYLNDEYSQIKEFDENQQINVLKNDKIKIVQKKIFEIFKRNIQNKKFLPIQLFINSKTSSHYTGDSYHIKKNIIKQNENHYRKKIFFNDSLLWENLPSESPTFTIMANAFKNTDLYL
jgi:hypothetical protein